MNFFKKETKYPEVVEQIHHEFYTASDRLLEEAKGILAEVEEKKPLIDKTKRLLGFGFKQTQEAVEGSEITQKAEFSQDQKDLVLYYQKNYLHKFITEEQVKEICFKYGLVCGGTTLFKGFVPDKNLKEIENFKGLREMDILKYIIKDNAKNTIGSIEEKDFVGDNWVDYLDNNDFTYVEFSDGDINVEGGESKWGRFSTVSKAGEQTLQICAPVKDMDMEGMTIGEGYKIMKIEVPDPVVLQPCRGGYLILTAWGDEASDPIVVNQKFN